MIVYTKRKSKHKNKFRQEQKFWSDQKKKHNSIKEKISYKKYVQSKEWQSLRVIKLTSNPSCQACWSVTNLHVHHWSYINLWSEKLDELFTLCKRCHDEFHYLYWTPDDMLKLTKDFIKTHSKFLTTRA